MNATIDGYLAFQRQELDTNVNAYFAVGVAEVESFRAALAQLPTAESLPAATIFTDGLGISHDTFVAAFPSRTFEERTIYGFTGWTSSEKDQSTVEIYGPEDNIVYTAYNGLYPPYGTADMEVLLATTLPEWKEAKEWLAAAIKLPAKTPSITAVNGRVVNFQKADGYVGLTVIVP